jgi:hypothetical protein
MNMSIYYKHTQFGTLTVSVLVAATVLLVLLGFIVGWHPVAVGVSLILLICAALFYSLTVEISNDHLEIRFGVGIIKKRFEIKDIEKAYPVRNRWYYGWGIRWIPHGWLYNVSGLDAIEIVMSSGKRYRVGTDQPNELAQVVNETRKLDT